MRFLFRKSASSTFDGNLNNRGRRLSNKCVDMTIFHAQAITSSDHSWRAPAQANRNGPGPYGLGTCVRQGPAARSSAVQNLGSLSIKFRLLAASLFIKPFPTLQLSSSRRTRSYPKFTWHMEGKRNRTAVADTRRKRIRIRWHSRNHRRPGQNGVRSVSGSPDIPSSSNFGGYLLRMIIL